MKNLTLFNDLEPNIPHTEGIKYAGSKLKIFPLILDFAKKVNAKTVLDGFSGTTRVSQAFAKCGYKVISNDISVWSEVFGTCFLLNNKKREEFQPLINHLNALPPVDGWFTENYGGLPNGGSAIQSDGLKKPWQIQNTQKLDAIRQEIENLSLSPIEKSVALTSLIFALDRVDNTLGHQAAYLKNWAPRSYKNLLLKIPKVFIPKESNSVFRKDIFDLIPKIETDLAYFDPPYGSNNEKMPPSRIRYASYYHLWTTICLGDAPPLFGKAKRRKDSSDKIAVSVFEEFRKEKEKYIAVEAIEKLIQKTNARWIILSYSSGGRATSEELNEVINRNGKLVDIAAFEYKSNVMEGMTWTNEWTKKSKKKNREFLFLIEK